MRGDGQEFYPCAKVAAEIAWLTPFAQVDIETLRAVVADEERRVPLACRGGQGKLRRG